MRANWILLLGAVAALGLASRASPAQAEVACGKLADQARPGSRITSAEEVPAGALPARDGGSAQTPAFCRLRGEIASQPGSHIGFELWLPAAGWNGKFEMVGNGGYSSAMAFPAMGRLLRAGYAVAATDTGHQGDDPDFARGHPEAIEDWAYLAVHLTAVDGEALTQARYGAPPAHRYFAGCSTGGQQAMSEAQHYPGDFDGIIAGSPGADRIHLNAGFLWQYLQNHRRDGSEILPASKLGMITQAVLAACRSDNGTRAGGLASDAWLDDPRVCRFRPESLLCHGGDGPGCLTADQVKALGAMYDGARDPRNKGLVAHGYPMGSESSGGSPSLPGWSLYWADPQRPKEPARLNFWRIWAGFGDAWDWWSFDFHRDMVTVDGKLAWTVNAVFPDLEPFMRSRGKLIAYHGLADPVGPFDYSIDYHELAVDRFLRPNHGDETKARAEVDAFYRLFLVPGMGHCVGGPGPTSFDAQAALEAWVERDAAPDQIIASHRDSPESAPSFTRPLCPYPAQAVYAGQGDPQRAESFACRAFRASVDR